MCQHGPCHLVLPVTTGMPMISLAVLSPNLPRNKDGLELNADHQRPLDPLCQPRKLAILKTYEPPP